MNPIPMAMLWAALKLKLAAAGVALVLAFGAGWWLRHTATNLCPGR